MSDFLNKLIAQLSTGSKINVGVSISLNVGLEMVVVEATNKKIVKYGNRPLTYNPLTREIEDYNSFRLALDELFKELNIIPSKANVVMNLPNVFFGHTFLPTTLDDESVTTALTSDVEQNYLFKKNQPSVSWVEVNANNKTENRYILYSAVQESVVNSVKQVFDEIGATLIAVENTNSSLIKTLEYTGITKEIIKGNPNWNILLISQNSYAVFSMQEHNVIEYFEDPLAIKSFAGDEVYTAVAQAASNALMKYPTDKLLVISETNDVSAEILALQMKNQQQVVFLECNKYAKSPLMDVDLNILPSYINLITPEVIGASIYNAQDFNLKLNFLSEVPKAAPDSVTVNIFGNEMELNQNQLMTYSVTIGAVVLFACYILSTVLGGTIDKMNAAKGDIDQQVQTLTQEKDTLQKAMDTINIYSAAKNIDKSMKDKVLYFHAIGSEIPAKVWLKRFYGDDTDAYAVEGETVSVDDLYLFFRGIKAAVPGSNLILSSLKVDDKGGLINIEESVNSIYSFSLTNREYNAAMARAAGVLGDGEGRVGDVSEDDTDAQKSGGFNVPKLQNLPGMQ